MDQSPELTEAVLVRPVPLWRNRDYLLLWGGQFVSALGSGLSLLAFPLLVLMVTNSPVLAGGISILRAILFVIFGLPAGAYLDRWDRKRTMIVCDIVRAVALVTIPLALLLGYLTIVQIYLVALIEGLSFVFFTTAQASCLPHVVTAEQLPRALSLNLLSIGSLAIIGPSLSGLLYGIERGLPFTVDAASYVVSFLTLMCIKRTFQEKRDTNLADLRAEIVEGLTWLWKHPLLRFFGFATGAFYFVFVSTNLLILFMAKQEHASSTVMGLIFSVGAVGYLAGTFVGPYLQRRLSLRTLLVCFSWLLAVVWLCFIGATSPLILSIVAVGILALWAIYDVLWSTYSVTFVPDALRGRISSLFFLLTKIFESLGPALAGVTLQYWGTLPTILLFTAWLVTVALAACMNSEVRDVRKVHVS